MASRRFKPLPVLAVIAFTAGWFALLAERPLYDPDEGRYAEIPREMLSGAGWVIPHLDGLAYIEKPPLQYWASALVMRLFGEGEAAARLWTGLTGYFALLVVFFMGARMWGLAAGFEAALLTAASALFFLLGHQLTLDMALTASLLAALACFIEAQRRREAPRASRAWMMGCWISMALAVLTKGLIGVLIPAATLIVYGLWQRDSRLWRNLHWHWGLPLFGLIGAPWFVLAAHANADFLKFFFIREHFERYLTPIEHRSEAWWFFAPVLLGAVLPWLAQSLRVLVLGWRPSAVRGEFDPKRVLWIWSVFVLVFFSFSDSKLVPYILPAIPSLALLCARPEAGHRRSDLWIGAIVSLAAAIAILGYTRGAWSIGDGRPLAATIAPILRWTSAGLACAVVACAGAILSDRPRLALTLLCAGSLWTSATVLISADRAASLFSAKDIALLLRAQAPHTWPVYSVQSYEQSLPYYLQQTVVLVDYQDEFDFGLRADPARGIARLEQFAALWRGLDGGYAVMPFATEARLAGLGVPMHEIGRFTDRVVVSRR